MKNIYLMEYLKDVQQVEEMSRFIQFELSVLKSGLQTQCNEIDKLIFKVNDQIQNKLKINGDQFFEQLMETQEQINKRISTLQLEIRNASKDPKEMSTGQIKKQLTSLVSSFDLLTKEENLV